jgi:aquaporin Z
MRRNLPVYCCEFVGTAIMLFIGITAVALMWAPGSPVPVVPNPMLRRLITGIIFAAGATVVVYSPLGQRSGGHINPAVTLAFWRAGKVPTRDAVAYVIAQFGGALAGAFAAGLAFRELTPAVQYAATTPGEGYSTIAALVAETVITFLLVFTIFVCVNKPRIAPRTGIIAGTLVALLVMIEAPVSGTSLNPARTLAPAILVPLYRDVWIYVAGPCLGALIAVAAYVQQWGSTTVCAKLYHTEKYPCPFEQCGYRLVSAGEMVMREGDMAAEAYVIERGVLEVLRARSETTPISVAQLVKGDWVGEMSLLLDEPRTATVIALSDAQLRRVTKDDFGQILTSDPERALELLRQLARRVRESSNRLAGRI